MFRIFCILHLTFALARSGGLPNGLPSNTVSGGDYGSNYQNGDTMESSLINSQDPIVGLHTPEEIIKFYGYPVETHEVVSRDGYILSLFRIPHGKNEVVDDVRDLYSDSESEECEKTKTPVVLHHGMLLNSASWLLTDENLPFLLADKGFDVWLPNARGTSYSMSHNGTLNSVSDFRYWEFSFHEIGKYDVPAICDYILCDTVTAKDTKDLYWVGHGIGASIVPIAMHYNPHYNSKICKLIALDPWAYMGATSPVLKALEVIPSPWLEIFVKHKTKGRFTPSVVERFIKDFVTKFCTHDPSENGCPEVLSFLTGSVYTSNINKKTIVRLASHSPDSTSIRTLTHLIENDRTCIFGSQTNHAKSMMPHTEYSKSSGFPEPSNFKFPWSQQVRRKRSFGFFSSGVKKMGSSFGKGKPADVYSSAAKQMSVASAGTMTKTAKKDDYVKEEELSNHSEGDGEAAAWSGPAADWEGYYQSYWNAWEEAYTYGDCKESEGHGHRTFYNLTRTKMPVLIIYGSVDALTSTKNVERTYKEIGSVHKQKVMVNDYNHMDLILAKTCKQQVFTPVLKFLLQNYEGTRLRLVKAAASKKFYITKLKSVRTYTVTEDE